MLTAWFSVLIFQVTWFSFFFSLFFIKYSWFNSVACSNKILTAVAPNEMVHIRLEPKEKIICEALCPFCVIALCLLRKLLPCKSGYNLKYERFRFKFHLSLALSVGNECLYRSGIRRESERSSSGSAAVSPTDGPSNIYSSKPIKAAAKCFSCWNTLYKILLSHL